LSRKASELKRAPASVDYDHAVGLYRQGCYAEVIDTLHGMMDRQDVLGEMARFYVGMSHRALGLSAMKISDYGGAEKHFRAAAGRIGADADISRHLAGIFAKTQRPVLCTEQMRHITGDNQTLGDICRLARAQWQAGERVSARLGLRRALKGFPRNSTIYRQLGLFAASQDDYRRARRYLKRAVRFDCTNWRAWRHLGLVCLVDQDIPAAVRAFQRAFDLQPNNLELAWRLSQAAHAGQQNGYGVLLHLPEAPLPESDSPIRQLAMYMVRESDYLQACLNPMTAPTEPRYYDMLQDVLTVAVGMYSGYADIHLAAGRVAERRGEVARAQEHARRAIEINPKYIDALVFLAKCHAQADEVEEGIMRYRQAISAGGNWADIHHDLSALRDRQNNTTTNQPQHDEVLPTIEPLRRAA
jgi:tetratricopeptide (TPR) repeat protein